MTLNTAKLRSPMFIFFIYIIVSGLCVMVFRFILPGSEAPLWIYSREWRLIKGALDFFNLFPALAFSALVIPFGLVSLEESYQTFTEIFFKRLLVSVVTAICAAVIYGLIFFLALPMAKNYEENLRYKGELYQLAKLNAQEKRNSGDWLEASQFIRICDHVWPESPELSDLRIEIDVNVERLNIEESRDRSNARAALARDWRNADVSALPGDQQPLNAAQAISMSAAALADRKFFDAHWLATLGERLALVGSPEAASAARLASEAWNMIASQAPNQREQHIYELYNLKLSGYQAMNTGDWIRAFYIFQELLALTPDDPDAANFFAASERGAREYAFFIEEMEVSLGEILTGALFSLPVDNNGRAVLRFSSLTTSDDVAYGMGLEYMSFDANAHPVASVISRYAKVLPFELNGKSCVLVLTHALDRNNEANNVDSEWLIGNKTAGGIILNVTYEDLLLLADVRRGLTNLQIDVLFSASGKVGDFGYVYQIFQAEILNRLGAVLFFLPVSIMIIIFGWRYRVKTRPRYLFVLMLPVLPVVFNGLVFLYRAVFNTLGIWLVLSIGFSPAIAIYIAVMSLLLLISLIVLASQNA